MLHDGGGLYLQVRKSANDTLSKSWVLRVRLQSGRLREMGLGSALDVSLADARISAEVARKHVREGRDPIELRLRAREAARQATRAALTFEKCVEAYMAAHKGVWCNEKRERHWGAPLKRYAYPAFGSVPVAEVTVQHITKVLDPLWSSKTETASRLRGRIESVLDWATVRGHRSGENPARWRGHLAKVFPAKSRVAPVKHLSALPFQQISSFVGELRAKDAVGPRAFEFMILTACRTSEVLGARWPEMDLTNGVWTVPAERMKSRRTHRVPLSDQAQELLRRLGPTNADRLVFEGRREGIPLSNMVFLSTLRRMNRSDLTGHGFRSTFRDWAAECTDHPNEVAEAALAHAVGDKTEAAYRRGDLFDKRRRLMQDWADYCSRMSEAHAERRTRQLE